jgi:glycine/D-amino acid oxidase-like deaminating enzyme
MPAIEQSCFWLATRRPAPVTPLTGEVSADIAILGGGFTGLWTALRLKELAPEARVVLLEQAVLGYGGSGRNAGQVSGCLDHGHAKALAHFGLDEARRMARLGLDNVDEMAQFCRDHQIDCDLARTGQLLVALTPAQIDDARENVAAAEKLGVTGLRLLSGDETRAELNSPLYLGGGFDPTWGTVHPIKLVDGLKRVAESRGVRIFEHSRVTGLDAVIRTDAGTITADKVILATNAYTHHLAPQLLRRYIPLYDYILVSEPLTPAQHAAIGWRRRQAVVDGRTFFNYYRLTAENRILWGTSEAVYYRGNRVDESCDHSEKHYAALRESFRRHFPQIAELEFPFAWGGPIASTTRFTPFFGTLAGGRITYGLGYTGLGIANAHLAGKILAHLALGKPSPLLDLAIVRNKPFPYPPEPFRSWAVKAITHSLRRVDAGGKPGFLLRALDKVGIGFSS